MGVRTEHDGKVRTVVVAVGNQKGGVAKTTNVVHLAAALGELGKRVLVIDVDMNYGATTSFGIPPDANLPRGTLQLLLGECDPEEVIIEADDPDLDLPDNVDLIPANRVLENLDNFLAQRMAEDDPFSIPWHCLKVPLEKIREMGRYDFVFIDTGPSAQTPTRSAYLYSDYFIISVIPDPRAMVGLNRSLQDIAKAREPGRNPDLQLLGIILADFDRRYRLARSYEKEMDERLRGSGGGGESLKFSTVISRAAAVGKAVKEGKTVLQFDSKHPVSEQFRSIAREFLERISPTEEKHPEQSAQTAEVGVANG